MLPDSKNASPKCLYLDTNKWIDLSRARYGQPEGRAFQASLSAIIAARDEGKVLVPYSMVTTLELESRGDSESRKRAIRFLVELSENRALLPFQYIVSAEIQNAMRAYFGKSTSRSLRPNVVAHGVFSAFGRSVSIKSKSRAVEAQALLKAYSAETSLSLMLDAGAKRKLFYDSAVSDAEIVKIYERARSLNLSPEQRYGYELIGFLSGGDTGKAFVDSMQELGLNQIEFADRVRTTDDYQQFVKLCPALWTFLELLLARDKNPGRPVKKNDFHDLLALSVAIPYCNIVVTEKDFADMIRRRKLDSEFGTTVLTKAELIEIELMRL